MRPIDADTLRAKAKLRGIRNKAGKVAFRRCILLEDIDNEPTVELKPPVEEKPAVVRGTWVQRYFEMYCDQCWEECPTERRDGKLLYTYPRRCPFCSALMYNGRA